MCARTLSSFAEVGGGTDPETRQFESGTYVVLRSRADQENVRIRNSGTGRTAGAPESALSPAVRILFRAIPKGAIDPTSSGENTRYERANPDLIPGGNARPTPSGQVVKLSEYGSSPLATAYTWRCRISVQDCVHRSTTLQRERANQSKDDHTMHRLILFSAFTRGSALPAWICASLELQNGCDSIRAASRQSTLGRSCRISPRTSKAGATEIQSRAAARFQRSRAPC
jgi:hypothetical protein